MKETDSTSGNKPHLPLFLAGLRVQERKGTALLQ